MEPGRSLHGRFQAPGREPWGGPLGGFWEAPEEFSRLWPLKGWRPLERPRAGPGGHERPLGLRGPARKTNLEEVAVCLKVWGTSF